MRDAAPPQPVLQPQRHHEQRRPARLRVQASQRGVVEVVVVVVRCQHQIDVRQRMNSDAGWLMPPGAGKAHWRCAVGKHRIGQHVESTQLRQHRGMADPGDRRAHPGACAVVRHYERQIGTRLGDGSRRRRGQAA
jgi:hypothetical protein